MYAGQLGLSEVTFYVVDGDIKIILWKHHTGVCKITFFQVTFYVADKWQK